MTRVYVVDAGRKFYYLQWTDPDTGKRITRSSKETTRRGAERKAMNLENQLSTPRVSEAAESWDAFLDYYQHQHLDSLASKSELKAVSVLDAFGKSQKPDSVRHVTTPMLTRYAVSMRQAGKSEATVAGHMTTIRAALSWARQQGYIATVPPIPKTQRSLAGRKSKGRPITNPEFVRMLRAVPACLRILSASTLDPDSTCETFRIPRQAG